MEQKYIITGVTSSLMNNGMGLYLTSEGYARSQINDRPNVVSVYLADGVTEEQFKEQLNVRFGRNQPPDPSDTSLEARARAAADEKMQELVAHYGVSNADYAVVVGDTVIRGNSRRFLIKDVTSLMGLAKDSLSAVSNVTRYGTTILTAVLAAVVAVILGLIVSSTVKRQRKSLGILKGMGYSSRDLRRQMALKIMPVTIVSVIIASVLTVYVYSAFWMMAFSVVGTVTIPVIILADVVLVAFCYLVTYLCAGRIKAISVTELMTE